MARGLVAVAVLGAAQQRRGGVPFGARSVWERSSPPLSVCLPVDRVRAAGLCPPSFLPCNSKGTSPTHPSCTGSSRGLGCRQTKPSVSVQVMLLGLQKSCGVVSVVYLSCKDPLPLRTEVDVT